jgi:spore germination protein GerM
VPLLVVLALLAALGGCGLAEDGEPEAISPENVPPDLLDPVPQSTTTTRGPGEVPVPVYLVDEVAGELVLVATTRTVQDPQSPGARVAALLAATPTEREVAEELTSYIPPDVKLLDSEHDPDSRELVLDLSPEIFDVQQQALSNAFAQIVYTATELDTVTTVRFRVDGEPRNARDAEGGEQRVVDRSDYRELAPR